MASIISNAICHSAGRNNKKKWSRTLFGSKWRLTLFGVKLLVLLLLLSVTACKKEEIEPYSNIPEIQLIDVSHTSVRQYEDILFIRIFYKDGDGDLGFESPEEYALFVRDIRLEKFDGFYIGPITPPGVTVPIKGYLDIEFPVLFLFGNGDVENTRFQIKMIDRAGNESNLLETGTIAITRE